MSDPALAVHDLSELTALLRAIVEAKFYGGERDLECATGAVLAAVARRIRDAVAAGDEKREGAEGRQRSERWWRLTSDRAEWQAALESAAAFWATAWATWADDLRRRAILDLVAPFELDDDQLQRFMEELDRRVAAATRR